MSKHSTVTPVGNWTDIVQIITDQLFVRYIVSLKLLRDSRGSDFDGKKQTSLLPTKNL